MFSGVLKKMYTEIDEEVEYYLDFKDHVINFNQCLEKKISMPYQNIALNSLYKWHYRYSSGKASFGYILLKTL